MPEECFFSQANEVPSLTFCSTLTTWWTFSSWVLELLTIPSQQPCPWHFTHGAWLYSSSQLCSFLQRLSQDYELGQIRARPGVTTAESQHRKRKRLGHFRYLETRLDMGFISKLKVMLSSFTDSQIFLNHLYISNLTWAECLWTVRIHSFVINVLVWVKYTFTTYLYWHVA